MSAATATATTSTTATSTKTTAKKPVTPTTASSVGSDISTSLLLAFILGLIALFGMIGIFSAKNMLGTYFNILYYIVFPISIYFISVGFNAITQRGTCNAITNMSNCFKGAGYTLGYLYSAMILVNLVGPNGIFTFEPDTMVRIKTVEEEIIPEKTNVSTKTPPVITPTAPPALVPEKPLTITPTAPPALSSNVPEKGSEKKPLTITPPARLPLQSSEGDPQGGGKRILRQRGGGGDDKMSDAALMIRSFFTTLRAPAMSLFIRDPNAATLEDIETKSPIYTGIGIGFWACLATISGQVISNSIAQVC